MSSSGSPPKPWERAAAGGAAAAAPNSSALTTVTSPLAGASAATPALPARSDALNSVAARTASNYSTPFNRTSPYSSYGGYGGMSGMSGMGSYSSYSSPYSRFGGGGMYGGMGGMGGMYGGMGGMGGYGMGGGMYGAGAGMYGDPNQQSLTQSFGNSTQATFQMIESIVGAFGGFAQMLESTYMATHSSFFAMVSVAEQFGNLRQTLGSVLGIFALMRWTRAAIAKITGRPPPASASDLNVADFAAFAGRPGPDGTPAPKPSRKPLIFFALALFGLPYLMGKLIRALAANQEEQQRQLAAAAGPGPDGSAPLDPSKLDFCRVLYDYAPQQQPGQALQDGIDLDVRKGDLVAVLSKLDPMGAPSDWWRCRARDGRTGYLPAPYLETIQRRAAAPQLPAVPGKGEPAAQSSRVNTMTTNPVSDRAQSLSILDREKAAVQAAAKLNPIQNPAPIENFQRGGFYS